MKDYQLRIGDETTLDADLLIDNIIDGSININESGMSDFTVTIPKSYNIRQYVQDTIYLMDETASPDDIIWYGTIESWESSETGVDVTISGRGPLLDEEQSTILNTYTSTFADDVLEDLIQNYTLTNFDFVTWDRDLREMDTSPTVLQSLTDYDEFQLTIPSSETFNDWEVYVKYSAEVTSSDVGISDTAGGPDETTVITEDRTEFGHTTLTTAGATDSPYIYVDTSSASVAQISIFPSDSTQRYIIEEELDTTILEALQTISEIAGYRFGPLDFNAAREDNPEVNTHILFPIGYQQPEPSWRIISADRASDYSGYANRVRVRGAQSDNGYYSATIEDADEITEIGKTISRHDKRPDLESDEECRAVAKTLLANSIQNRGESGSITTTIPTETADVPVGSTTPISVWSETFNDGGMTGTDALYFTNEYVGTQYGFATGWDDSSDYFKFQMNLYPHLDEMDNPATIISEGYVPEILVLYPDGTIEATFPTGEVGTPDTITSATGAVDNRTTQEVVLQWDYPNYEIIVDGSTVASTQLSDGGHTITEPYFGNRNRTSRSSDMFRAGSNTVVNLTWDEDSYDSSTNEYTNFGEDFTGAAVQSSTSWQALGNENAAYREGIQTTGANDVPFEIPHNSSLNIDTSDFAVASWVRVGDFNTNSEYYIASKGITVGEGWGFYLAGADAHFKVNDGTSTETHTITNDDLVKDTWYHVAITVDQSTGTVKGYLNGEDVYTGSYSLGDVSNTLDLNLARTVDGGTVSVDETRVWKGRVVTASEIDVLAGLGPQYDDNYIGGLDELRYYHIDSSGVSTQIYNWEFDDDSTPNTAIDSEGTNDLTLNNVQYGAVKAPVREISYDLIDNVTADVKFDIAGRIDTELSEVKKNIENVKD